MALPRGASSEDFPEIQTKNAEFFKEVVKLLNKGNTKKSLELSVKFFESADKFGQSLQAGAGTTISSVFDAIISGSGLMGPFNTFLSLVSASSAAASADALSALYDIVTSETTIAAIDAATVSFGALLDTIATGLETASGFSVNFVGADFNPFNLMIEGFASFLGGGIFGAAIGFLNALEALAAQMVTEGPPIDPFAPGGDAFAVGQLALDKPGPVRVPSPRVRDFEDLVGGGALRDEFRGLGGKGYVNPGDAGFGFGGEQAQLAAKLDKLIDINERAWLR